MKKLAFLLIVYLLLHLTTNSFSQETKKIHVEKIRFNLLEELTLKNQYLDSTFVEGKIIQKGGAISKRKINYNLITGTIFYIDKDNKLKMLDDLSNIIIIKYGNRKFLPINSKDVAEVIKVYSNGITLLLKRDVKLINEEDHSGPYGKSLVTANYDKITTLYGKDSNVTLDKGITIQISLNSYLYIKKGNKLYPFKRIKDLKKIYSNNWDLILAKANDYNLKKDNINNIIGFFDLINN